MFTWPGKRLKFDQGGRWLSAVAVPALILLTGGSTQANAEPPAQGSASMPRRIVAIAPNSAEIICALGACDHIVGVSKFCVYPASLLEKPQVGGLFDPDLERIAALRPDLLVLRGRNEALTKLAGDLNIQIYRDDTDSFAGIKRCIRDLGALLERATEGEDLIATMHSRVDRIRARAAGRERPRVLVTLSRRPDRLAEIMTAGTGSFISEMIAIAGGENVFDHLEVAYPQISTESIMAQRPEVILELMPEVELTDQRRAQLLDQWRALGGGIPAVLSGRVYFVTRDHALIPSPRILDVVEEVSRLLHPEQAQP